MFGEGVFQKEHSLGEEPGQLARELRTMSLITAKKTKRFCFLMNAMRFREMRCGFLEAACQECLEKKFSTRSISFKAQRVNL